MQLRGWSARLLQADASQATLVAGAGTTHCEHMLTVYLLREDHTMPPFSVSCKGSDLFYGQQNGVPARLERTHI